MTRKLLDRSGINFTGFEDEDRIHHKKSERNKSELSEIPESAAKEESGFADRLPGPGNGTTANFAGTGR